MGWVDPFSDGDYSKRQRQYATVLKDNRVYTPELVINGRDGFVGSDRLRATHRIQAALADSSSVGLELTLKRGPKANRLLAEYVVGQVLEDAVVNVALLQKKAMVEIPRGENAGRTLTHHHVVREFVTVKAEASGQIRLKLPDELAFEDIDVIGFVQDKKTMHILGANLAVEKQE